MVPTMPSSRRTLWLAVALAVISTAVASVKPSSVTSVPIHTAHKEMDNHTEILAHWLTTHGFPQYATPEFLERMSEDIAADSIEDLAGLLEDDEYEQLDMPLADAKKISEAAQREVMTSFLEAVATSDGQKGGFVKFVDALLAKGWTDAEDVSHLTVEDGQALGMTISEAHVVADAAQIKMARELFTFIMSTYQDENGSLPLSDPGLQQRTIDSLIIRGVRSVKTLAYLISRNPPDDISPEVIQQMMSHKTVLNALRLKQEL